MKLTRRYLRQVLNEELEKLHEASDLTKAVLPKLESILRDIEEVEDIAKENRMPAGDLGKIIKAKAEIKKLVKKIKSKSQ